MPTTNYKPQRLVREFWATLGSTLTTEQLKEQFLYDLYVAWLIDTHPKKKPLTRRHFVIELETALKDLEINPNKWTTKIERLPDGIVPMTPHDVAIINKYNVINPDDNPTPFTRGLMRVKTKDHRFTVI